MKKIIRFAMIVLTTATFLLLFGNCNRQAATMAPENWFDKFDNEGFNQALTDIYSNYGAFTRASGPEDTETFAEDVEMLLEWLQDVADEYDVKEVVENSAYYKDLDMIDFSDPAAFAGLDDAVRLEFIKANATPEFTKLYTRIAEDFSLYGADSGIEHFLSDNSLLPNEKLALTAGFMLFENRLAGEALTRSGGCENAYNDAIDECFEDFGLDFIGYVVGGGGAFGPIGALVGAAIVAYKYDDCLDDAKKAYNNCIARNETMN